jgi:PAS domain S-box-containing protein
MDLKACEIETVFKEDEAFKVLIVEDTPFINNLFAQSLTQKGYKCFQAFTLVEAHDILIKEQVDLVILDLHLPDGEGEELIENIYSLRSTKIIIFTADTDKMRRDEWYRFGVIDYLIKDQPAALSINEIKQTIERLQQNHRYNVLVIDDSSLVQKKFDMVLSSRNYNVLSASDAPEGLKILREQPVHLVLLDLELPTAHGSKVLEAIKQNPELIDIPVLIVSGTEDSELVRRLLKRGAADFIQKPFITEEIVNKVDFWIDLVKRNHDLMCQTRILEEYKEAVDSSSIVSKTDSRGVITYVNDKFLEISGYSREELIGKNHNIVRHPDMDAGVFADLWTAITNKQTWQGTIKNLCKDGSAYYVRTTIKSITDYEGNILEYIGIRTDVTQIEQIKNNLQKQLNITEKGFEEVYRKADAYHGIIDKSTILLRMDMNGVITYANELFSKEFGFSTDEVIREKLEILFPDTASETLTQHMWRAIKAGSTWKNTLQLQAKSGKTLWVDATIVPRRGKDDKLLECVILFNNITQVIELHQELEETQRDVILMMGELGETRSKETGYHVKRVAEYSRLLALKAGLPEEKAELLRNASPMHDIGKVGIPDDVLLKPGKLDADEWEIMQTHAELGYNVLKGSNRPLLKAAAIVAHQHHEKWDGSGYPQGLAGNKIHVFGRITAIADVFDALGSDRPYKQAWPLEKILDMFKEQRGKHFDPYLIDTFFEHLDEFIAIAERYKDV